MFKESLWKCARLGRGIASREIPQASFGYCHSLKPCGITCEIRNTKYVIRNTLYGIRYTKYVIRNTLYELRHTKYDFKKYNIYVYIYDHTYIYTFLYIYIYTYIFIPTTPLWWVLYFKKPSRNKKSIYILFKYVYRFLVFIAACV